MLPVRLDLENFMSYEKAELNFDFSSALISGSNGHGKCLPGSTILTNPKTSERISIKELCERGLEDEFFVSGLNEALKLHPARVVACQKTGVKPLIRITLNDGTEQIVSETHPLMVGDLKTVEAKHIRKGAFVASPRFMPYSGDRQALSLDEARVLAALMADGSTTTNNIKFTNMDRAILETLNRGLKNSFFLELRQIGNGIEYYVAQLADRKKLREEVVDFLDKNKIELGSLSGSRDNSARVRRLESLPCLEAFESRLNLDSHPRLHLLLRQYFPHIFLRRFLDFWGTLGKKSIHKSLDLKKIMGCSDETLAAFIGTFIDCDGYVPKKIRGGVEIGLGSRQLVYDLHLVCHRLGIHSYISHKVDANGYPSWKLSVNMEKDNFLRFYYVVRKQVFGPKAQRLDAIYKVKKACSYNPNVDVIPPQVSLEYFSKYDNLYKICPGAHYSKKQLREHGISRHKCAVYGSELKDKRLLALATSDIFWLQVEKVESLAAEQTYDIEVDNKTHLYALDRIITHNSSLFEAMSFALYGETRHKNADSVVKRGQLMCRVEFRFEHDGRLYRIIRTRNVKQSKMDVTFDELRADGTIGELTHDTNKLTDAEIRRVVKSNHDIFINSSYFRQNSFFDFVQGTFATRQAIISSLLNLDKWGRYQKQAKESLSQVSDRIDHLKRDLDASGDIGKRRQQVLLTIESTNARIAQLQVDEGNTQERIKALELKINENREQAGEYYRYQDLKGRISTNQANVKASQMLIKEREQLTEKTRADIEVSRAAIEQVATEISLTIDSLAKQPTTDPAPMEEAIFEGRSQLKILTQQIETLVHSDTCLMCGHEWHDRQTKLGFVEERQTRKTAIEEKLGRAEAKLKAVKLEIAATKIAEHELDRQKMRKAAIETGVDLAKLKQSTFEDEIARTQKQLEKQISQLAELEDLLGTIQAAEQALDLKAAESALTGLAGTQKMIGKQLSETSYSLGGLVQEEKNLVERLNGFRLANEELTGLNRQAAIYGQLARAFSKDGIQAIIIDNIVEELTNISNYWLSQFSNESIYISFVTQKKNTKGDWRETFDIEISTTSGICQFEDFSGGEQFRIGFAVRLALSTIQAKRMGGEVQILLLDEVSTSLDAAGLETFVAIIRRLEKEMKVMVITHDDKLKEGFDTIISIEKTQGGSIIVT